jgi:hypothetical protein
MRSMPDPRSLPDDLHGRPFSRDDAERAGIRSGRLRRRAAETAPTDPAVGAQPAAARQAPAAPTPIRAAESPTPAADAVTEVLAVEIPPTPRARAVRAPRVAPARTAAPAPTPPAEVPTDRDSAIDRLFAPLLDSDTTEPLQTPRAVRPARKPREQD